LITSFYSLPKMRSSAERIGAEAANSGVRPAIGDDRVVAAVAPDQVLAAAGRDRIGAVGGILAAHDGVVATKPLSIAFYLSDETRLPLVLFIPSGRDRRGIRRAVDRRAACAGAREPPAGRLGGVRPARQFHRPRGRSWSAP
jgi:hypothetical protein